MQGGGNLDPGSLSKLKSPRSEFRVVKVWMEFVGHSPEKRGLCLETAQDTCRGVLSSLWLSVELSIHERKLPKSHQKGEGRRVSEPLIAKWKTLTKHKTLDRILRRVST